MSSHNSTVDDCRERLDVIESLAGIISRSFAIGDREPELEKRETCKLAILIGELCEQADKMLETLYDRASLKAIAGGES